MDRPSSLFAATNLRSEDGLPLIRYVDLTGKFLRSYLFQRFGVKINGKPPPVRAPRNNHECVQPKSKCKRTVASYEHTAFYYAAWKSKGLTLANALELAPKLFHIAKEVHDDPEARKT
jgi:hypothetical protein